MATGQERESRMVEWLLIAVLYTPRSASHIHDIRVERFETQIECTEQAGPYGQGAKCIPVAPLPEGYEDDQK